MDTVHECDRQTDGQTDGQNYDNYDRAAHRRRTVINQTRVHWPDRVRGFGLENRLRQKRRDDIAYQPTGPGRIDGKLQSEFRISNKPAQLRPKGTLEYHTTYTMYVCFQFVGL